MVDLSFDSVSKKYRIQSQNGSAVPSRRPKFLRSGTHRTDFWALKDVSFEVKRGESLGIIGHNGAGKSTILKLLSNITTPTRGQISINGRLAALLEVGSGFHPELTGRENTYLSGSILGMRRREITEKLESIIDFAGVREFIDIPTKQYSSGMHVRLGFSIAAHLTPDILLLDEVLAVGDRVFQEKCIDRVSEMHEQGTTLVFISHDLAAVKRICQRLILLEKGQIIAEGASDDIIRRYTESATFHQRPQVHGELRAAEVVLISFYDRAGRRSANFTTGEPLTAQVDYIVHRKISKPYLSLFFYSSDNVLMAQWTTAWTGPALHMEEGPASIEFSCAELGLQPGVYHVDVTVQSGDKGEVLEWQSGCSTIHVESRKHIRGAVYMPHRWREVSDRQPAAGK